MSKTLFALTAAAAILAATSNADATDSRTLSEFLSSCSTHFRECRGHLDDYVVAANTQKLICLPKDLSSYDAVGQELDWLRHVGAHDDKLFNGNVEDAEWTAITTLWPCKPE